MKNPLAKRGMEQIARCYEDFARRAEKLTRQSLGYWGITGQSAHIVTKYVPLW